MDQTDLPDETALPDHDASIAGYRLVRMIGTGRRAEVYLALGSERMPVAIKILAVGMSAVEVPILSAPEPVDAPTSLRAALLPPLRDVASLPDGRSAFVHDHLGGPLLTQWLQARSPVPRGELVTALAPLVATVGRLNAAGWAAGELTLHGIRFDASGKSWFTALSGLNRLSSADAAARVDRRADVASLVELIIGAFTLAGRAEPAFEDRLRAIAAGDGDARAVEEALFGWATATPVDLRPPSHVDPPAVPSRIDAGQGDASPVRRKARRSRGSHATSAARIANGLDRFSPASLARRVLTAHSGPALLAGSGVVLAVLLVVVLAPSRAPAGADAEPPPAPSSNAPASSAAEPDPAAQPEPDVPDARNGDDPVTAASTLLSMRDACLDGEDSEEAGCLADVDARGSPRAAADAAGTARSLPEDPALRLVQRLGSAAIIEVSGAPESAPASLLMVRSEAGWRLRDVFEG
jgi:hypothetical protein